VGLKIVRLLPLADGLIIQAQERKSAQRASGFIFDPEHERKLVHLIISGHPLNEPSILFGAEEREILEAAVEGYPVVVSQDSDQGGIHFSLLRKQGKRIDHLVSDTEEWNREFEQSILPGARHDQYPQVSAESLYRLEDKYSLPALQVKGRPECVHGGIDQYGC
jgi:hypothetical protein